MGYTFTDMSLVFNRTYANNLTLVAPIDTGHWYSPCVAHEASPLNCSGWDRSVVRLPFSPATAYCDCLGHGFEHNLCRVSI